MLGRGRGRRRYRGVMWASGEGRGEFMALKESRHYEARDENLRIYILFWASDELCFTFLMGG